MSGVAFEKNQVIRVVLYLIVTTLFHAVISSPVFLVTPWFVSVNIMPFIIASIALYDGPYIGGGVGFYAGVLLSLSSTTVEGAEALIMALFGIICGSAGVMLLRKIMPSALFCGVLLLATRGIISAVYYQLFYEISFISVAIEYLKITVVSTFFGIFAFKIIKKINKRFSEVEI